MIATDGKSVDDNAVENMVLLGFNFSETETDMFNRRLTKGQIERMYGQVDKMVVLGFNKNKLIQTSSQFHLNVQNMMKKSSSNEFQHYLYTLSGHSGCGLSIKPCEIFAIQVGAHGRFDLNGFKNDKRKKYKQLQQLVWDSSLGSFINDTILKHCE